MPTFKTTKPKSVSDAVRSLIGGGDENAAALKGMLVGSQANQHTAMAEKARAEAESIMAAERARQNPDLANEYAATTSGITVPQGRQMRGFVRGESMPVEGADAAFSPDIPYTRPDINPAQERSYRAAIGALIANQLATGNTNAEQLTHGGGNLMTQAVRAAMAEAPTVPEQNRLGASIGERPYEPFSGTNKEGVVTNLATGEQSIDPAIAQHVKELTNMRPRAEARLPARITNIERAAKVLFGGDMNAAKEWEARSKNKSPEMVYLDVKQKMEQANPLFARKSAAEQDKAIREVISYSMNFAGQTAAPPKRIKLDANGNEVK